MLPHQNISPGEVELKESLITLDVREAWEAEIAKLPNSILIPIGELRDAISNLDQTAEWLVYCHHGARSIRAVEYMLDSGFKNVKNLDGGIDSWALIRDPEMTRY